jgi:uncharacterized protein YkwD
MRTRSAIVAVLALVTSAVPAMAGAKPSARAGAAGSCANASLDPSKLARAVYRQAVVCLINRQRALAGRKPLRRNPRLERAGQGHTDDMVANGFFSHASFDGRSPEDRIIQAGYTNRREAYDLSENIGFEYAGSASASDLVDAWMHSVQHRFNILKRDFEEIGIGVRNQVPLGAQEAGGTFAAEFGVRRTARRVQRR